MPDVHALEALARAIDRELDVPLDVDDPLDLDTLKRIAEGLLAYSSTVYQAFDSDKWEGSNRLHLNRGHATNHARHSWSYDTVRSGRVVWDAL